MRLPEPLSIVFSILIVMASVPGIVMAVASAPPVSAAPAAVTISISDPTANIVVEVSGSEAFLAVRDLALQNGAEVEFSYEAAGIITLSDAIDIVDSIASETGVLSISSETKARLLYTPNDDYVNYQWGLGSINAYEAWDITRGEGDVIVAVLDTGIDWNHPDLAPNMWSDADGYHGYSFISSNRIPMDDNINSYDANGIWIPNTYTYHGTHVAGVVGAVMNNNDGIAGLAQVRLMAVKVMNDSGEGTDSTVASGIRWAVDPNGDGDTSDGADIITMSLGVDGMSSVLQSAVNYASRNHVAMVAASGNAGTSYVSYPAAYPQVIAVGAVDSADRRASFSNFGNDLDIMAPGVQIYSTQGGFGYQYLSGTSTAAPHVAGVAALMLSINPALTPEDIGDTLNRTARDISRAGYDTSTGWGIVDAFASVEEIAEPTVTFTDYPEYVPPNSTYAITWMVSGGDPGVISSTYLAWGESPTALTHTTASFSGTTWALFTAQGLPSLEGNGTIYLRAYATVDGVSYESVLLEMPVHDPPEANFFIQFLKAVEDFIVNDFGLYNFLIVLAVLIAIPAVVIAARPKRRRTVARRPAAQTQLPLHAYQPVTSSHYLPPPPPPPPRYEAYVDVIGGDVMPRVIKIIEGTKVVWVNRAWAPPPGVSIKSGKLDTTGEHPDGLFQSGMLIAPGDFWSCQFHRTGVFDYYLTGIWKAGKIVVEPYGSGTATSSTQAS